MVIIYEKIQPKIKDRILSKFDYKEEQIKQFYPNLRLIKSDKDLKDCRARYCYNYALKNNSLCDTDVYL